MQKLIQIKVEPAEKKLIDQIAKMEGFRSAASFAYYTLKQQIKKMRQDPLSEESFIEKLSPAQKRSLSRAINEVDGAKFEPFDLSLLDEVKE